MNFVGLKQWASVHKQILLGGLFGFYSVPLLSVALVVVLQSSAPVTLLADTLTYSFGGITVISLLLLFASPPP